MMFRAAIAFLALALPAFAQHGGARAGSFGSRGFSGHAGFSSRPALSRSPSYARTSPLARYGAYTGAAYRTYARPVLRSPYYGNRFAAIRPSYSSHAALSRSSDRDRFDARRRQFHNWYVASYPYWAAYPYLYDPNAYNLGLYDWSDPDDATSAGDQPGGAVPDASSYAQSGDLPGYLPPYPEQRPPYSGEATAASPASDAPVQLLTVIFKNGRTPIKVENYLMTTKTLTDLDPQHYEQIPLDEIDLAATRRFNNAAGVDFEVPSA